MPRGERELVGVRTGGRGEGGGVEDLEGASRVAGERAFAAALFFHFRPGEIQRPEFRPGNETTSFFFSIKENFNKFGLSLQMQSKFKFFWIKLIPVT